MIDFNKIYHEYSRPVMSLCYGMLKDDELAKEAFQDCFMSIAKCIDRFDGVSDYTKNYIMKAARNSALNIYRKNKRISEHEVPLPDEGENSDSNYSVIGVSIASETYEKSLENIVFDREDKIRLIKAMDLLDAKNAELIRKRYSQELTFQQIAEHYGINEDTAKKRVYRSLEKLKRIFYSL